MNSLFILNLGLLLIMFSAVGGNMEINYSMFTPGVIIAIIGAIMFYRARKVNAAKEEK